MFFGDHCNMENTSNNKSAKNNKLVGIWQLEEASLITDNGRVPILGQHPGGILILSAGLHFSVIVNNPDISKFASGDRMNGTEEENKVATQNSLALYGTYRVDEQGDFLEQKILGSTFPNWNGLSRGTEALQLKTEGGQILENLTIPDVGTVEIIWRRLE
jgi:hypothetical protein